MPSHPTLRVRSPRVDESAKAPLRISFENVEEEVVLMAIKLASLFFLCGLLLFIGSIAIGWLLGFGFSIILLLTAWILYTGAQDWERRNGLLSIVDSKVTSMEVEPLEGQGERLGVIYEEP